jgi:hypothetical protein
LRRAFSGGPALLWVYASAYAYRTNANANRWPRPAAQLLVLAWPFAILKMYELPVGVVPYVQFHADLGLNADDLNQGYPS